MSRRKSGRRQNSLHDNDISIWNIPEESSMDDDHHGRSWSPGSSDVHDPMTQNSSYFFHPKEDDYKNNEDDHPSVLAHIETASIDISSREAYAEVRPPSFCRPLEKNQRRSKKLIRFISEQLSFRNKSEQNVTSKKRDNSERRNPSERRQSLFEPVQTGRRGRMDVIAGTVSVSRRLASSGSLECEEEEDQIKGNCDEEMQMTTQFRLSNRRPKNSRISKFLNYFGISVAEMGIYDDAEGYGEDCTCFGIQPNQLVTQYLHWTFRRSFMAVFFSAALGFFGINIFFSILLLINGRTQPMCVQVNGISFSNYTGSSLYRDFGDAFTLSWTSFATVGYGLIYPTTSAGYAKQYECTFTMLTCSLESFVGILFASFCGAVVFGKVARIRSIAHITFSEVITIRYGEGVLGSDDKSDEELSVKSEKSQSSINSLTIGNIPCPVLEFRVANRLHSKFGGEIIDCSMNIVASIDASKAEVYLQNGAHHLRRRKGKRHKRSVKNSLLQKQRNNSVVCTASDKDLIQKIAVSLRESAQYPEHPFEEDQFGMITSNRVFVKPEMESHDHPFFKKVWTVSHTLDEESPLLLDSAKEAIRLNQGFWPAELNDAESVRACLNLDQLLVSFSGTSNADANSVYAQKVYCLSDVCIGYRYVNMMYRDEEDGMVKVDLSVIDDVVEQYGGGGEQLNASPLNPFSEMLVL